MAFDPTEYALGFAIIFGIIFLICCVCTWYWINDHKKIIYRKENRERDDEWLS
ncbi:MAG: hypothetical protein P1Q69_06150 [Candidatus Thorarchaeota archaeon]|nr:hypothetical protein [Candidatus Thorarchaeota archaeon]